MCGIGEVDARRPFRRDRDCTNRGVEMALLEAADNRLHIGNRDQPERPLHLLRDPAPQVDAEAGNRAVTVDVGRYVIDGDAQSFGFVLLRGKGGNHRRRQANAKDEENSGEPPDTAIPQHVPPPLAKPVSLTASHERFLMAARGKAGL